MVQGYQSDIEPGAEEMPASGPPPPHGSPIGFAEPPTFVQAEYASWVRVDADSVITTGPALLTHVILRSTDNGSVIVFEGMNATGRRAFSLGNIIAGDDTNHIPFDPPLLFRNGIFVDLTGAIVDVMVAFIPVREEHIPFLRYTP